MDANIGSARWLICQIIRLLRRSYERRDNFFILPSKRWRHSVLSQLRGYVKRDFYIWLSDIINPHATQTRFYGFVITARVFSLLCQGHKRDMQSSHEYVLLPYTRAPHFRRIYRTLMHNALRDDGKYGYITRQRPMLFSLASHWLMLIRNQRSHTNARYGDDRRSLRRTLRSLPLSEGVLKDVPPRLMRTTADLEKS